MAGERELVRDGGALGGEAVTDGARRLLGGGGLGVLGDGVDELGELLFERDDAGVGGLEGGRGLLVDHDFFRRWRGSVLFFGSNDFGDLHGAGGCGWDVSTYLGSLLVVVGLGGDVEGLSSLGAVAVDGYGLDAETPGFHVGVGDVLDGAVVGKVDGLGDGSGEEGLGGGHHADVAHVLDGAGSLGGLEGAIEDGEVLVFDSGRAFDGSGGVDVADDGVDVGLGVAELDEG